MWLYTIVQGCDVMVCESDNQGSGGISRRLPFYHHSNIILFIVIIIIVIIIIVIVIIIISIIMIIFIVGGCPCIITLTSFFSSSSSSLSSSSLSTASPLFLSLSIGSTPYSTAISPTAILLAFMWWWQHCWWHSCVSSAAPPALSQCTAVSAYLHIIINISSTIKCNICGKSKTSNVPCDMVKLISININIEQ